MVGAMATKKMPMVSTQVIIKLHLRLVRCTTDIINILEVTVTEFPTNLWKINIVLDKINSRSVKSQTWYDNCLVQYDCPKKKCCSSNKP